MGADFTTIPVGPQPIQACPTLGDGTSVGYYNQDIVNVVNLSRSKTGKPSIPLQPLTPAQFSGTRAMYVSAKQGTADLIVMPEGGSMSPSPAQIAASITASGVSLLSGSTLLNNTPSSPITAGNSTIIGPLSLTQPGYELGITLQMSAAAANPSASIFLEWSSSISGLVVAQERWIVGAANGTQKYCGTGPTKGDTLNITITNQDAAQTLTYSLTLSQNSRTYVRDDWRQITTNTVGSFTNANYDQQENFLFNSSPNVNGNTTISRLLTLYAGDITLCIVNGINPGTYSIIPSFEPNFNGAQGQIFQRTLAINETFNSKVTLPRQNCTLQLTNGAAGVMTMITNGIISEQLA